jgi:hypothetical protein
MDVNYYLHREQVERMRAERAADAKAGEAHRRLADLYRARLRAYRGEPRPGAIHAPELRAG